MLNSVYKINKGAIINLDSRKVQRNLLPLDENFPDDFKFEFTNGNIIPEYVLLSAGYDIDLLVQKRSITPLGVKEVKANFKSDNTKLAFVLTSVGKQTQPQLIENALDPFNPDIYWPKAYLMISDDGARAWKAVKRIDAGVLP